MATGSANLSKASSDANDEDMLVIRGNTRVAYVYGTEFMRCGSARVPRVRLNGDAP